MPITNKSKLIDIECLKTFKTNYDSEVDEKIAGAGTSVTKESIETALGYTPANANNIPTNVSSLTNDAGYLTEFTEEDPTVPTHVKNITTQNIASWNAKADVSDIPIYSVVSTSENGLCPKRDGSATKFLRGDGTWAVPPTGNDSGIIYNDSEPSNLTSGMTWISDTV